MTAVVGAMRNFVPERMVRDTGVDDQGQHRRRRHVDRRVRLRRAGLDPVVVRDGRQLPRHRGPDLRIRGRDHRPAGGRVRDAARRSRPRPRTRSSSPNGRDPGRVLPAPAGTSARAVGVPVLLLPGQPTSLDEITATGPASQGDFAQGALVQETINAFEQSFRRRAWVDFPLAGRRSPPRRRWRLVRAATNAARLVTQVLTGEVWPPLADRHALRVGPGRPAVRAAGHGRHDAGRALRRPGHRVRQRSPGAGRVGPAPRAGRQHGAAIPDLRRERGARGQRPGRRARWAT